METQYNKNTNQPTEKDGNPFGGGRAIAGLIVVVVGTLLLAREVGADIPYWIFSWHMLLIAFGLYLGARHSFRNPVWMIPVAIGSAFLLEDLVPEIRSKRILLAVAYHRRWVGNDLQITQESRRRHI